MTAAERVMIAVFDYQVARRRWQANATPANKRLMDEAERRMEKAKKEAKL